MSLLRIVLRNVSSRGLSSALTALSIALGVALVVTILSIQEQGEAQFDPDAFGYELIVGAPGSATQLVLNTVYHLDTPPGNIPFDLYTELKNDRRRVSFAAPMAVGDSYRGFRVVGTSDVFIRDFEIQPGLKLATGMNGRVFDYSDERLERVLAGEATNTFEAVVGATAARETGLATGSRFEPTHGVESYGSAHDQKWTVVGVLAPTGTPADRAIYINIDSFFSIKDHVTEGRREVSAVVVKTRRPIYAAMLKEEISARPDAMAVGPARVVADLLDQLAPIGPILLVIAGFVIVVAGISIMVSIYNSMAERRHEIAIMRALGARRWIILTIVLLEAAFLCLIGGVVGILLGHGLIAAVAPTLQKAAGLSVSPWSFMGVEGALLGGLVVLGVLVGIVPALRAFRVEIADGLSQA